MANTVEILDRQTSQAINDTMATYYTTKQNIMFVAQELAENLAYLANTDVQTRKTNIIRNSLFRNRTRTTANVPPTPAAEPVQEAAPAQSIKSQTDDLLRMFDEPAPVAQPQFQSQPAPETYIQPSWTTTPPAPPQPEAIPYTQPPVQAFTQPEPVAETDDLLSMFNEYPSSQPVVPEPQPAPVEPAPQPQADIMAELDSFFAPPAAEPQPQYTPPAYTEPAPVAAAPQEIPTSHIPAHADISAELDSFFSAQAPAVEPISAQPAVYGGFPFTSEPPVAEEPRYYPPVAEPVIAQDIPDIKAELDSFFASHEPATPVAAAPVEPDYYPPVTEPVYEAAQSQAQEPVYYPPVSAPEPVFVQPEEPKYYPPVEAPVYEEAKYYPPVTAPEPPAVQAEEPAFSPNDLFANMAGDQPAAHPERPVVLSAAHTDLSVASAVMPHEVRAEAPVDFGSIFAVDAPSVHADKDYAELYEHNHQKEHEEAAIQSNLTEETTVYMAEDITQPNEAVNLDELKNKLSVTDTSTNVSPTIKNHFASILQEIESSLSNMKNYNSHKEELTELYEKLKSPQNMSMKDVVELSARIVAANKIVEDSQSKAKEDLDSMENVAELFKNMADALIYNVRKAKNNFNRDE